MKVQVKLCRPYDREPADHLYGDPFDEEINRLVGGKDHWSVSPGEANPTATMAEPEIQVQLHEDGPVFEFIVAAAWQIPTFVTAIAGVVQAWAAARASRARALPEGDFNRESGTKITIGEMTIHSETNLSPEALSKLTVELAKVYAERPRPKDVPAQEGQGFAAELRSAAERLTDNVKGILRFAKLERVLAFVCLLIPALLIWFDGAPIRDSISAYYDMKESVVFYFPLTVATMLFVVNGVVKEKRAYNWILGITLAGVILFDHNRFTALHTFFAVAFFAGNAVVMLGFSSKEERWFKAVMVGAITISILAWAFGVITLFWAEWISFAIIAFHYILESWGIID